MSIHILYFKEVFSNNDLLQVDVWSATTGKSATQLQPKQGHFLKPDSKPESEQGNVLWTEPEL